MSSSLRCVLRVLCVCLAIGSTPVIASRTSRDALVPLQGKLGPDLFLAIGRGDLAQVQSLLARGADLNARDSLEETPLFGAAGAGQLPIVDALLRAGAKLDEPTIYGTPLAGAAAIGSAPVVKYLLARGADVNANRPDGVRVLMYAALQCDSEIVSELLRRKAEVNAKDNDGATALTYAARYGRVEIGRLLLDSGAAVDAADSHGWTPLMEAAVNGHAGFVRLLLEKGAKVNAREEKGRTPLILAATYADDPAVLSTLLEGGADIRATDARHRTALELATARGYTEIAALLRERGADLTATSGGMPPRTTSQAVRASLAALQRSMGVFDQRTGCVSCHQHGLGRMATGVAQQCGCAIDPALDRAQAERINGILTQLRSVHQQALKDPGAMKYVPSVELGDITAYYGFTLAGMAAHQKPANERLSAMAMVLARQQSPDGSWQCSFERGPMQSSPFTFTALTIQALRTYGPKARATEVAERLRRTKAWLLKAPVKSSEDRAFRLLGLKWAGASLEERRKATDELRADQRPDGGWPQPGSPQSDAYGTGQALYALHLGAGLPVTDPVYQKGVQFLLRTQEEDGSWFVPKRVEPLNNYFDAEFPHGEAQYASFNATCWATMALAQTMEPMHASTQRAARDSQPSGGAK